MAVPEEPLKLSVEEYLAFEEKSEARHEDVAGYVFAMARASGARNVIAGNVFAHARQHTRPAVVAGYTCLI